LTETPSSTTRSVHTVKRAIGAASFSYKFIIDSYNMVVSMNPSGPPDLFCDGAKFASLPANPALVGDSFGVRNPNSFNDKDSIGSNTRNDFFSVDPKEGHGDFNFAGAFFEKKDNSAVSNNYPQTNQNQNLSRGFQPKNYEVKKEGVPSDFFAPEGETFTFEGFGSGGWGSNTGGVSPPKQPSNYVQNPFDEPNSSSNKFGVQESYGGVGSNPFDTPDIFSDGIKTEGSLVEEKKEGGKKSFL
jgi:hypothetical protein